MTKLEDVEQWLYEHDVRLIEDNSIVNYEGISKAFVVKYMDASILVYAPEACLNDADKRCVLIHEIYHYIIKRGFYGLSECPYKRRLIEGRVKNKMVKDLLPFDRFIEQVKKGLQNFEIADLFDVSEELVNDAYKVYEGKIIFQ